jgi:hypothetical protein
MSGRISFLLLRSTLLALIACCGFGPRDACAQFFDFETDDQLEAAPSASGDFAFFDETTSQALNGTRSLRFVEPDAVPFRSFTYEDPTGMTSGTITVWFYDADGFAPVGNPFLARWGLSIVLEDADNPADFGAVEIVDLPYGGQGYYATEGNGDRLLVNDRFDSSLPGPRAVGWHRVDFDVSTSITLISVDGNTATQVAAPGGEKNLRLRFMADSASVGGFDNWFTFAGGDTWPAPPGLVLIDDIAFNQTAPSLTSATLSFEDSPVDYDTVGSFMGPEANNNPFMHDFVNTFDVATTVAHAGTHAAYFSPGPSALKSVALDLAALDGATTQVITLHFYDALGADQGFDKVGGAVIVESGLDPADFIALEIWNAPYPLFTDVPNYYLTARPVPSGSGFYSGYFGDRAVGWHTVEIILTAASSRIVVDGIENDNGAGVIVGPGLDTNPKLRLMGDSPSLGGFNNWLDPALWTDPESPELDGLYFDNMADYVFYDDLDVPVPPNAAAVWTLYE